MDDTADPELAERIAEYNRLRAENAELREERGRLIRRLLAILREFSTDPTEQSADSEHP